MKTIKFTIKGNQENPQGNPIPYFRTTQAGQFNKGAKRYHAWKDYVRAHYLDALGEIKHIDRADFGEAHDLLQKKPIAKQAGKIHMRLCITWANKAHADSDNIFKGIADALFMDDKYLSGEFDYHYGDQAQVEVTITFYELGKSKTK